MDAEVLGKAIEIAFVTAGLAVMVRGGTRRLPPEGSGGAPRATPAELALTAVAWKMPGTLVVSLVAHLAFGIALGLLCTRHIRHGGHILRLTRQAFSSALPDSRTGSFGHQETNLSLPGSLKHSGNRIE